MTSADSLMSTYKQFNALQNPQVGGMQPAAGVATGQMLQPNGTMGTAGAVPAGTTGGSGAMMGAGAASAATGIVDGIATMLSGMAQAKAIPDPVQNVPTPPAAQTLPLATFQTPQVVQPKPLTRPPGAV